MTGACQTVAVVSPHLDDAVFSCFEHMREARRRGASVTVVNCFSRFRNGGTASPLVAPYMRAANCAGPAEYEALRKAEDGRALAVLGIESLCLDFIDAAFRGERGTPDYGSLPSLFDRPLQENETRLAKTLSEALNTLAEFDVAWVPMAVGNHVDHLLTRAAAERCARFARLAYYADMPYALRPWKWRAGDFKLAFPSRPSMRLASPLKRQVMGCYESQLGFFMRRSGGVFELLLTPPANARGNPAAGGL